MNTTLGTAARVLNAATQTTLAANGTLNGTGASQNLTKSSADKATSTAVVAVILSSIAAVALAILTCSGTHLYKAVQARNLTRARANPDNNA